MQQYRLCKAIATRDEKGMHSRAQDIHEDIEYGSRERVLSEFLVQLREFDEQNFLILTFKMQHENAKPYVFLLKDHEDGTSTEIRLEVL